MKNLSNSITKALSLAYKAHKNQFDKGGYPYVLHPITVAMMLARNGYSEQTIITGLLHDVIEDTDYTIDDIKALDFPDEVTEALSLLTHDKSIDYMEYICSVSRNPIAKAVKIADILHNSDKTRLKTITEKDELRLKKYEQAIRILHDSEEVI